MIEAEVLNRLGSSVPPVLKWIEELLKSYVDKSVSVSSFGFPRLSRHFPHQLLQTAKAVEVLKVPFPPLGSLGLPELSDMEKMPLAGITYMNTFFVKRMHNSESLNFHELVHVVQWGKLGPEKFLLAYGIGLLGSGYFASPLEQMAYDFQRAFDKDEVPPDLVELIEDQTERIWSQAEKFLR